jgi:hypothetical protein
LYIVLSLTFIDFGYLLEPSELADLDIKVEVEGSSKKFDTEPESSSSSLVKVIDSVVSAQPLK